MALGNLLALATISAASVSGIDISGVAQGMEMVGMGATLVPCALYAAGHADVHRELWLFWGLLASLAPAWRASRLDPVAALNKT